MEWRVVKTGAETFDVLHAYGLGILVACAGQSPVELIDEGLSYKLRASESGFDQATQDILDNALVLPPLTSLQGKEENDPGNLAMSNLDGLLALLFTTPGVRAVSVADLQHKQRTRPEAAKAALKKVKSALKRWSQYALKKSRGSRSWLHDALQDYDLLNPMVPIVERNNKSDIALLMTTDPAFSYSTRRPHSDGLVTDKTNVTLRETRFAALLVCVGAARFLRAQRVGGDLVNFYVPLPSSLKLAPNTTLPLLPARGVPSNQALVLQWLTYQDTARALGTAWTGLAYQVMQTQGAQQSISYNRGCLDSCWLTQVERQAGSAVIGFWKWLLGSRAERTPFEIDNLIDALIGHRMETWMAHLIELSRHLHCGSQEKSRPYSLQEIKEVTFAMVDSVNTPLSSVLERKGGTLRFGHALRLLGQQNPAPLRDIIDALETVHTCDQLVRVLAQAAQQCTVASAKSPFILVPTDDDLKQLLDDVDRHGARTIAGLLIILSALRYPRHAGSDTDVESIGFSTGGSDDSE